MRLNDWVNFNRLNSITSHRWLSNCTSWDNFLLQFLELITAVTIVSWWQFSHMASSATCTAETLVTSSSQLRLTSKQIAVRRWLENQRSVSHSFFINELRCYSMAFQSIHIINFFLYFSPRSSFSFRHVKAISSMEAFQCVRQRKLTPTDRWATRFQFTLTFWLLIRPSQVSFGSWMNLEDFHCQSNTSASQGSEAQQCTKEKVVLFSSWLGKLCFSIHEFLSSSAWCHELQGNECRRKFSFVWFMKSFCWKKINLIFIARCWWGRVGDTFLD